MKTPSFHSLIGKNYNLEKLLIKEINDEYQGNWLNKCNYLDIVISLAFLGINEQVKREIEYLKKCSAGRGQ